MDIYQLAGLRGSGESGSSNIKNLEEIAPNHLIADQSSKSYSKNMAQIHRAEWQDYIDRFAPVENELIKIYNDDFSRDQSVKKAGLTARRSINSSKNQADRTFDRYGLNLSGHQRRLRNKNYALEGAAAEAGAKNAMRTAKESERMNIVTGGLSTPRKTVEQ
jgi:hypothetical protein